MILAHFACISIKIKRMMHILTFRPLVFTYPIKNIKNSFVKPQVTMRRTPNKSPLWYFGFFLAVISEAC